MGDKASGDDAGDVDREGVPEPENEPRFDVLDEKVPRRVAEPKPKNDMDGDGRGRPSSSAKRTCETFPLWCQSCGASVEGRIRVNSKLVHQQ
jgi:hypothetical protein